MQQPSLLKILGLTKGYPHHSRVHNHQSALALDHVSFTLKEQQIMAVTGSSGAGKTTLLRLLAGLDRPDFGSFWLKDQPNSLKFISPNEPIRMIFSSHYHGFNPLIPIGNTLDLVLKLHGLDDPNVRHQECLIALNLVELLPEHYDFYLHQLSLGERLRAAIARAILLQPRLLLAEDFLSRLDRTAQAQLVNLLLRLRNKLNLTLIMVLSDIDLIGHFSDQLLILHHGRLIEKGRSQRILAHPNHPISQRLINGYYNEFRQ